MILFCKCVTAPGPSSIHSSLLTQLQLASSSVLQLKITPPAQIGATLLNGSTSSPSHLSWSASWYHLSELFYLTDQMSGSFVVVLLQYFKLPLMHCIET